MREIISGATAIVRGALAAGCDFFAGYPITPATAILLAMLQALPKVGGIAIQGEDEIASIGMCLGAVAAGCRVLTATSGPGMSLYSENLGLAVMAELPLVVVDVQRLGPATGGATTIGQGDVQFARWGVPGGYPLIVLAPSNVLECATLTVEAFALARRFRCPVVVLTDKELNMTMATVEMPDLLSLAGSMDATLGQGESPVLGRGQAIRFTGSTHNPQQMITRRACEIEALNRHLVGKIERHRRALERVRLDLQQGAATLLVSYGTSAGAMEAALKAARASGLRVSGLVVQSLWPVPELALRRAAEGVARIVVGELNPGLYARELRHLLPTYCDGSDRDGSDRIGSDRIGSDRIVSLNRLDGEMLTPEMYLAQCLR